MSLSEEKLIDNMMEKLSGQLTEKDARAFNQELTNHPELKSDFEFFETAWKDMDTFKIGDPRPELRTSFYEKLDKEMISEEKSFKKSFAKVLDYMIRPMFLARASFGLLILAVGFILGGQFNSRTINVTETAAIESDDNQVSKLANYIPATARLEEMFTATQATNSDKAVDMLLKTLSTDPNVNVRVVALEELNEFAGDPKVRQKLVKMIKKEQSPLVQMELLNTILDHSKTKEKISTLEKMLANQKNINPIIKQKIETDLPILRASL